MTGDEGQDTGGGFLPPQPGGREPDLAAKPAAADSTEEQGPQSPAGPQSPVADSGWSPPAGSQPAPGGPAPGGQQQSQWGQPQQQWNPQPQWSQQQPQWGQAPQQQWQAPPAWAYQPQPPDNGSAVAALILSVSSIGLLLFTVGLSSIVSVICGALAIFYGKRGRDRVDRGETPKQRNLAQAGFVAGIVGVVLGLLATAFWILIVVLYYNDDEFRRDLERELETATILPLVGVAIRGAALLLS